MSLVIIDSEEAASSYDRCGLRGVVSLILTVFSIFALNT